MQGIGLGYIFINLFENDKVPVGTPEQIFVDTLLIKADDETVKADNVGLH